jgi:hypothetical protein
MSDPIDKPIKQAAEELDSPDGHDQDAKEKDSGDLEERDYTNPK